jgi:hypothetical protein
MSILKGETTAPEAARKHGLPVADIEHSKDTFVLTAEDALRSRPKDKETLHEAQTKKLDGKVGQLVMDLDIAREAMKLRPFPETTSHERGRQWPAAPSDWCAGCLVLPGPGCPAGRWLAAAGRFGGPPGARSRESRVAR